MLGSLTLNDYRSYLTSLQMIVSNLTLMILNTNNDSINFNEFIRKAVWSEYTTTGQKFAILTSAVIIKAQNETTCSIKNPV